MNLIQQNTDTAVVILNWNGQKWLEQFIPFVIEHTPSQVADIVVADNASTDHSVAFIRQHYPQIQIIELSKNYGYAEGYNRALASIPHLYSVLLNSDIEVSTNWLEPLIQAMSANPNLAACQPKIKDFKRKTHFEYAGAAGGFLDAWGYPFCRGRIFNHLEEDLGQYNEITDIFWATGACMVVNTSLYKTVGGLDGDFFAHMEEIDLCWRFKSRSYQIQAIPQSTVYHVGGGTLSAISPKKTYLNFRNNLLLLYKNLPSSKLAMVIGFRLILDGVAGVKFLLDGQPLHTWAVVKAHFDFYSLGPKFKPKRKINLKQSNSDAFRTLFPKSIVWLFYIKKHKKFSDLVAKHQGL
jgi:GT2 family glycosyltransferase